MVLARQVITESALEVLHHIQMGPQFENDLPIDVALYVICRKKSWDMTSINAQLLWSCVLVCVGG